MRMCMCSQALHFFLPVSCFICIYIHNYSFSDTMWYIIYSRTHLTFVPAQIWARIPRARGWDTGRNRQEIWNHVTGSFGPEFQLHYTRAQSRAIERGRHDMCCARLAQDQGECTCICISEYVHILRDSTISRCTGILSRLFIAHSAPWYISLRAIILSRHNSFAPLYSSLRAIFPWAFPHAVLACMKSCTGILSTSHLFACMKLWIRTYGKWYCGRATDCLPSYHQDQRGEPICPSDRQRFGPTSA